MPFGAAQAHYLSCLLGRDLDRGAPAHYQPIYFGWLVRHLHGGASLGYHRRQAGELDRCGSLLPAN
jgi:hypothetical protein